MEKYRSNSWLDVMRLVLRPSRSNTCSGIQREKDTGRNVQNGLQTGALQELRPEYPILQLQAC
eukprot:3713809-Pleurochrysis_carterae.AAC.1